MQYEVEQSWSVRTLKFFVQIYEPLIVPNIPPDSANFCFCSPRWSGHMAFGRLPLLQKLNLVALSWGQPVFWLRGDAAEGS